MALSRSLCLLPAFAAVSAGVALVNKKGNISKSLWSSSLWKPSTLSPPPSFQEPREDFFGLKVTTGLPLPFSTSHCEEHRDVRAFSSSSTDAAATGGDKMEAGDGTDVMTEFMVDMTCEGCAKGVRRGLEPLPGVKSIDIDVKGQLVRVYGSASVSSMTAAMESVGRVAKVIGQGTAGGANMAVPASAVAEFKGPAVFGVVRIVQLAEQSARVEASLDGLMPGQRHGWSINEFGDLTAGPSSTGKHYNPENVDHGDPHAKVSHAGDLGNLSADKSGHANYLDVNNKIRVDDIIGRSIVVYQEEDDMGISEKPLSRINGCLEKGLAAAVIARSASVGENYKTLCTCDGTVIWQTPKL